MRTTTSAAPSRFITRLSTLAAAAVLGITALVLAAPVAPAQAHEQLVGAKVETSATGEPTGLRLSFSDNVLEVGTEIIVTDESGASVVSGLPKFSGRDVTQPLETPLADGAYKSVWRVVSGDGHPIEGGFTFDITDGVAGEVLTLETANEEPEAEVGADATEGSAAEGSGTETEQSDSLATAADTPSFATFAPYLGAGVALAAIIVIAAVIVRARKNAASRNTSKNSPEKE